ncbi:MAG: hypothetical protein ACRDDY_03555 [Clostridium sp.]|uniref:hypothetical protein n=1 Tax=Clostridium sp. TaxID=1506 RepID=UPI003EE78FA9
MKRETIKSIPKYGVHVCKIDPSYEHYDKVQYLIISEKYLQLGKIMEICKEVDDEYGYMVYNQEESKFQNCYYRMEGRGLLFIEKEWEDRYV